jgi:hypothetical protein
MRTKQKLILLISPIIIIILGVVWFTWHQTVDCPTLKTNIQNKIDSANYCNNDNDCIVKDFGCPFGCGSYLNNDFDTNEIQKDIESFQSCIESKCEYKCRRPLPSVCVNNKCVGTQCEPDKQYKVDECECPESTAFSQVYNEEKKDWFYVCELNK